MTRLSLLALLATSLMFAPLGCGEDNNHDHDHEDNNHDHDGEEHICVHFEDGPEVAVSGAAEATGTLNESFEEHTRIDVSFPAESDTVYVQWTPEEAGEFEFWLSKDVPFVLLDGDTEVAIEESGGAAEGCETLAVVHKKFDVEEKAYTIKIGPATAGETISFVAEHGEHEDESK